MGFFSFNTLIGLIGMVCGFFLIKEAYYFNHHILFLKYIERKFGPGMGTSAYKLIGLSVIIFSFFVFLGQINLFQRGVIEGSQTNQATQNQNVIPRSNSGGGPNIAQ